MDYLNRALLLALFILGVLWGSSCLTLTQYGLSNRCGLWQRVTGYAMLVEIIPRELPVPPIPPVVSIAPLPSTNVTVTNSNSNGNPIPTGTNSIGNGITTTSSTSYMSPTITGTVYNGYGGSTVSGIVLDSQYPRYGIPISHSQYITMTIMGN